MPSEIQTTENDLGLGAKILAGILLTILTVGCTVTLIGYWPDRMPGPKSDCQYYVSRIFHVKLIDPCTPAADSVRKDTLITRDTVKVKDTVVVKIKVTLKDSLTRKPGGFPCGWEPCESSTSSPGDKEKPKVSTITLSNLLLLLVALGGFLGNMIHIASSFTAYVGARKYRRSWTLWYIVKPFTASALAMALYFAFRANFLSSSNDSNSINPYGILTLAMMTGMFTEAATRKLKELFDALFKPKDAGLPDKLDDVLQILDIAPGKVDRAAKNSFTLKGKHLDAHKLTITINNEAVTVMSVKPETIGFDYTPSAAQQAATVFKLVVNDEKKNVVFTKDLPPV